MQRAYKSILNNENGNALLLSIMVLVALTALSIVTIRMSVSNLDQAANDKFHKMNFFKTDADTELVSELVEQSIEQRESGSSGTYGNNGDINIINGAYYLNTQSAICIDNIPTETNRDIEVANSAGEKNVTYVKVYGNRQFNTGSGLETSAGYLGRGKGLASGGLQIIYTIRAYGKGLGNSRTRLSMRWRHVT